MQSPAPTPSSLRIAQAVSFLAWDDEASWADEVLVDFNDCLTNKAPETSTCLLFSAVASEACSLSAHAQHSDWQAEVQITSGTVSTSYPTAISVKWPKSPRSPPGPKPAPTTPSSSHSHEGMSNSNSQSGQSPAPTGGSPLAWVWTSLFLSEGAARA